MKHVLPRAVALLGWLCAPPCAAAAAPCPGDCDGDDVVTVDEVLVCVGISLGRASLQDCPEIDVNGDGAATIDEVLMSVGAVLNGCPPAPSPTPAPSPLIIASPSPTVTPAALVSDPTFGDVTGEAGVVYVQREEGPRQSCFVPPVDREQLTAAIVDCWLGPQSGGAAVGDYDGDGWPDLYVTRLDADGILFRNNGDGTFTDVTAEAGLAGFPNGNGAAWGDVNNDGHLDLYVNTVGETRNYLFINDGNGRFTEEAQERGADVYTGEPHYSQGVSFGDYDRDGWIDLYTTEWRFWDFSPGFERSHSRLLRNRGAEAPGYFEDVTVQAGVDLDPLYGYGVVSFAPAFVDLDGDGWQELAIVSDKKTSELFWNNGDGTFTRGTEEAGINLTSSEMGSTFADYDGDGDLDWFVTAISCEPPHVGGGNCTGNNLYRYEGDRRFSQANDDAGVRVGHWGWGAVFFDYDNDGDVDLAMVNGSDYPGWPFDDAYHDDPMLFWRNDGTGRMTEMAAAVGLTDRGFGKGILAFDYDGDGDLDLFLTNSGQEPKLYRNDGGNVYGWIRVKTEGRRTNRDGYGARVLVTPRPGERIQIQEIGVSSHYLGQSDLVAHFGLGPGNEPVAEVKIIWPASEQAQVFTDVPRNSTLHVIEPVGTGDP
jgi:hypothetical protein